MKTLYLLRHAKSSWDSPTGEDHDRPLAVRGERAAQAIGEHLIQRKAHIDLVLCSSARRTVDTASLVLKPRSPCPPVEKEHGLYLCGSHILLERLRDAPDSVVGLMLVAHNPDVHDLACFLCEEETAIETVLDGFPAGALAVFLFEVAHWRDLEPGSGRLMEYVVPRKLT